MSVSAGANPPSADSANTGPDTCTSDAPDSSDAAYAPDSSDTADSSDAADSGSNARSNATYAGSTPAATPPATAREMPLAVIAPTNRPFIMTAICTSVAPPRSANAVAK